MPPFVLPGDGNTKRARIGKLAMKAHEPGEPALVSPFGETYELSFFIRNTYGWVGLLGTGQGRREGVLAIRYDRSPCAGVVSPCGSQRLALMDRTHGAARPPGPEQEKQR